VACQRYIELNPVRAGMVRHPADYMWSTYRVRLFRNELNADVVDTIRSATNGNCALGNERFAEQVSAALGQRATRGRAGRPRKEGDQESGDLFV
jgi:putative transposase